MSVYLGMAGIFTTVKQPEGRKGMLDSVKRIGGSEEINFMEMVDQQRPQLQAA